ncbi:hypothetical protein [Nocardioides sp. NPDC006273]|uniref:hypothetical protein n=1 Tax=Nocardioides sp. NPDC006273 TaxID=3155598 RepID=UPI0033B62666
MVTPPPPVDLTGWGQVDHSARRATNRTTLRGASGAAVDVELVRCAAGRLREAYPVSEHDVEVRVGAASAGGVEPAALTALLGDLVQAVLASDPECRRVVLAIPEGDLEVLAAAEDAGFRYVVDVDLPDEAVSLAVAEPAWVTAIDMDLDHVPT